MKKHTIFFKKPILILIFIKVLFYSCSINQSQRNITKKEAYLFTYFTGNQKNEETIRFATSEDGYNYKALNNNKPVINSTDISETGGIRDPHILRGNDGKTFYMVATDMVSANGWNSNRGIVLLKSNDLINWKHSKINFQKRFSENENLVRVWAPQTIYDTKEKKYMIYFSLKYGENPDKIYYSYANEAFTDFTTVPKQLFFHPENKSCIDGDIVEKDGKFHLFFKTEGHGNGIKQAVSNHLTTGYVLQENYLQQTNDPVEGSGVFKLNDGSGYILMYDLYTKGKYQFTKSKDLEHFKIIDEQISIDFHPRHGAVMPITKTELERLQKKWPTYKAIPSKQKTIGKTGNPVLPGFYADPDIIYSQKNKKFYLYPTSDGFDGWSGNYFKTFSSENLIDWKDEGVILYLPKDVKWGARNAWAPTAIEKYINGKYKYFYYFTAAQKIGLAVSDEPTGSFTDSGKPLISKLPDGVSSGQQIDPMVFEDPVSKKCYLYWGNGYMAVAELNTDMTSIKANSIKIITPNNTFREGAYVFYRKGIYYFLWSENDTRSPDYKVRYGTSDNPLGPVKVTNNNIVIQKNEKTEIYGTGHNSVIQIPHKDEWYIIYHRFNYPNGIKIGDDAGFYREVCIDKLIFNTDGTIKEVKPTHTGINLLK